MAFFMLGIGLRILSTLSKCFDTELYTPSTLQVFLDEYLFININYFFTLFYLSFPKIIIRKYVICIFLVCIVGKYILYAILKIYSMDCFRISWDYFIQNSYYILQTTEIENTLYSISMPNIISIVFPTWKINGKICTYPVLVSKTCWTIRGKKKKESKTQNSFFFFLWLIFWNGNL